jgi:hypothetical protein
VRYRFPGGFDSTIIPAGWGLPTWIERTSAANGIGSAARFSRFLTSLHNEIRAQSRRDVRRLHRLPHGPDEVVAQSVEVSLLAQLSRKSL